MTKIPAQGYPAVSSVFGKQHWWPVAVSGSGGRCFALEFSGGGAQVVVADIDEKLGKETFELSKKPAVKPPISLLMSGDSDVAPWITGIRDRTAFSVFW